MPIVSPADRVENDIYPNPIIKSSVRKPFLFKMTAQQNKQNSIIQIN